jgi:hypothetical protein
MAQGYSEFELDIASIMKTALPAHFASIEAVPLHPDNISLIPAKAQGAYMLYLNNVLVYIGKTDSKSGFRSRLGRHYKNIQHRKGLDPKNVHFKAIRVFVFNMFDLEDMLIDEHIRQAGSRPDWNTSGFGSNDPGHKREGQDPAPFDVRTPIDIDREIPSIKDGEYHVLELLLLLKEVLPYTFRFESNGSWRRGHPDMHGKMVQVPSGEKTMRALLQLALNALGRDWQATVMPNRVILYKDKTTYDSQIETLLKAP